MPEPVRVTVVAADPVLEAGAVSALTAGADVTLVGTGGPAQVCLILVDRIDDRALADVRAARAGRHHPEVVVMAAEVEPAQAQAVIAAGADGLLRRREATAERLSRTVLAAAAGDCTLPPDVLGGLLDDGPAPAVRATPELDDRERAVLDLVADGHETGEIARTLAYSTRTVTSVVQDITRRFRLRNRAHAVAYVLRAGLL